MDMPTTHRERLRRTTTNLAIMSLGTAVLIGIATLGLIRLGSLATPKGFAIGIPLSMALLWSLVCTWISWRTRNRLKTD
jgi:uncharacterized membrane protein YdfJ with MMPL/SSD domain